MKIIVKFYNENNFKCFIMQLINKIKIQLYI